MKKTINEFSARALILVLMLLTTFPRTTPAQQGSKKNGTSPVVFKERPNKELIARRLEALIPRLMKEGYVPGLSVAFVQDSKLVWQRGFGVKNTQSKEPVNDNTVYEAASLSKPVFAYAVLKMVDSGKLDLDTPLNKYLRVTFIEEDERVNLITARRVLSHTTGFANWGTDGKPLKIFFTPGEKFSYSGEGYVYLQRVVEHLSGESLDSFMKKTVFEPLEMSNSSYVWQERFGALASFRHDVSGRVSGRDMRQNANVAASLQTTALDYAKFVIAIMDGKGLKADTFKQMLTPQINADETCVQCTARPPGKISTSLAWGLGWGLQRTEEGVSFWHWGDNGDSKCYVAGFEKQKAAVIVFTNSANGLSIIPDILNQTIGGAYPLLAWLNYKRYDSPSQMLLMAILSKGANDALDHYRESVKRSKEGRLSEKELNVLGYTLIQVNRKKDAIEVFKLNVELFPQSGNVYDSLAEAYATNGDKELAIKYYKKAVEMNPENTNALQMLKKLESN